jgi:AmmeMemoRadiSam system protein B
MLTSDVLPALRPIEVVPVRDGENETYLLRDAQQLSDRAVTVTRPVLFVLQYLDGQTQVATLQELWREAADGEELPLDALAQIVAELDDLYLLANDRSRARQEELRQAFLALPVRPHRFGEAGPQIAEMLAASYEAAGLPPPAAIANEADDLALLVAPHIDYARGGSTWAQAYALAKRRFAGDVAIVLGVQHQMHSQAAALTRKNYDTPFGEAPTDRALVDEIAAALPFDAFADEVTHRDEHSIELAAVALKHAFGDRCPAIVPVLCGSIEDFLRVGAPPTSDPNLAALQSALRRIVERLGRRALVVASVDFAHIGPQFGAPMPVTAPDLDDCLAQDRRLLELIGEGDAEGFFRFLAREGNARNVCGAAALYHALSIVTADGAVEPFLHHWLAEEGVGAVTFAAGGLLRRA